jgi:hypothetical protein
VQCFHQLAAVVAEEVAAEVVEEVAEEEAVAEEELRHLEMEPELQLELLVAAVAVPLSLQEEAEEEEAVVVAEAAVVAEEEAAGLHPVVEGEAVEAAVEADHRRPEPAVQAPPQALPHVLHSPTAPHCAQVTSCPLSSMEAVLPSSAPLSDDSSSTRTPVRS